MAAVLPELTHSPAGILRKLFIDLGIGSNPPQKGVDLANPWPVFYAQEPDHPDNCITLYDTDGRDDGRFMGSGELFYHYGIQVRIRATDQRIGWAKADSVRRNMAELIYDNSVQIDKSLYVVHCMGKIGSALYLGKETPSTRRILYTINPVVWLFQTA